MFSFTNTISTQFHIRSTATTVKEEKPPSETESETESDSGTEEVETDDKRREWMRKSMADGDLNSSEQFMRDFLFKGSNYEASTSRQHNEISYGKLFDAIEISDDEDDAPCDLPSISNPANPKRPSTSTPMSNLERAEKRQKTSPGTSSASNSGSSLGIGRIAQEEMATRKRESLGLVGERKLGTGIKPVASLKAHTSNTIPTVPSAIQSGSTSEDLDWSCQVCTL